MPVYDVKIDDRNPVIRFDGSWVDSNSSADPLAVAYDNHTFHATTKLGATATIDFYGTGISLFGAYRSNHGVYNISIDGQVTLSKSGSADSDDFHATLGSWDNLTLGQHEVVLTNAYLNVSAPKYVDLDYVIITTGNGHQGTKSNDIVLDDWAGNFTYDSNWGPGNKSNSNLAASYYNETFHVTNTQNAQAKLLFEGDAIGLYGATSTNHGLYSISLNGSTSTTYNGTAPEFRGGSMLYYMSGLPAGQHTLTVTNLGTGSNGFIDIDKAVVSRWKVDPKSTGKTDTAAIVGGVVGGVVALILAIFALWFCRRRRRAAVPGQIRKDSAGEAVLEPEAAQVDPFLLPGGEPNSSPRQAPVPLVNDLSTGMDVPNMPPPAYAADPSESTGLPYVGSRAPPAANRPRPLPTPDALPIPPGATSTVGQGSSPGLFSTAPSSETGADTVVGGGIAASNRPRREKSGRRVPVPPLEGQTHLPGSDVPTPPSSRSPGSIQASTATRPVSEKSRLRSER